MAGATTSWAWAPPSDHDFQMYVDRFSTCGEGALTEFAEPTTTVVVNGVVWAAEFNVRSVSFRPPGLVLNVRFTVTGSSRTLLVDVSPPESVAVSWISIQQGYSWSGATKAPLETPVKVWMRCVWQ